VKIKNTGFTLIELLTVVGIIAMLIGLLLPALAEVRRTVKVAQQKAQFSTIAMALEAYKNDFGSYPESDYLPPSLAPTPDFQASQRFTEAVVGLDLLGYHPDSPWPLQPAVSPDNKMDLYFPQPIDTDYDRNLNARKGPYIEDATKWVFPLKDGRLFDDSSYPVVDGLYDASYNIQPLVNSYVMCDVFGVRKISTYNKAATEIVETVTAGTPILYFKADTSSNTMQLSFGNRYDVRDNIGLIRLDPLSQMDKPPAERKPHPFYKPLFYSLDPALFYSTDYKIVDPRVQNTIWPHNPDSYILISAGEDGLYGNQDDITNF